MLDITALGHADDAAVITEVQDAVLLVDGSEHGLHDDRWLWVADEAGLFLKLLGEEVDTEVSVLASLSGGADADDLARATLEDQQVTDSDEVAWNGDSVGVGTTTGLDVADRLRSTALRAGWSLLNIDLDAIMVRVM